MRASHRFLWIGGTVFFAAAVGWCLFLGLHFFKFSLLFSWSGPVLNPGRAMRFPKLDPTPFHHSVANCSFLGTPFPSDTVNTFVLPAWESSQPTCHLFFSLALLLLGPTFYPLFDPESRAFRESGLSFHDYAEVFFYRRQIPNCMSSQLLPASSRDRPTFFYSHPDFPPPDKNPALPPSHSLPYRAHWFRRLCFNLMCLLS